MIINNHPGDNNTDKMQNCQDYIEALEEERRKIQVFQRELPLCLELVSQAIETCRKGLYFHGQSECSAQTSSEGPVFEEFIPIKRSSPSTEDEEQLINKAENNISKNQSSRDGKICDKSSKKSDWLRSVQLWNQTPDPPTKEAEDSPRKVAVLEVKQNGTCGAFHPFKRQKSVGNAPAAPTAAASSTAESGESSGVGKTKNEERGDSQRKTRRCWSPELHRRFLQALQQLGGAHVATPKQIRELMKVDGLTNDEVKSHLQKYRLHTRRPSPAIHNSNNPQAPQFVVVGGIWVPPPEYAAVTAATPSSEVLPMHSTPNATIYAPKATLPPPSLPEDMGFRNPRNRRCKQFSSDERGSHSDGRVHSSSPTSSSTHTTTASPAF